MKFNASEILQQAEKEYGLGSGEYLKIKEGDNKIRLLSEGLPHSSIYKNPKTGETKKTFKFLCWVLDRKDKKIKPYFMPVTVMRAIESLQLSEDYAFTDVPMPYDININAKGAGIKEVVYSVIPARINTPLTAEEENEFNTKSPIAELQKKLRKQEEEKITESQNEGEINVEEIPFE